jgi:hypothetical protein
MSEPFTLYHARDPGVNLQPAPWSGAVFS